MKRAEPRAARRQLEVALGRLDRHGRRERPELLAVLDVAIEPVAHLGVVRRGEDAAVAERARAELGGAVHPADDAAGGELVARCVRCSAVVARRLSTARPSSRADARQLLGVDRRTPERMIGHVAVGVPEVDAVGVERRAERAAGVAGRAAGRTRARSRTRARMRALAQPLSATPPPKQRSARPVSSCSARVMSTSVVLEHALHAGGEVGEAPALGASRGRWLVRRARRAEELDEPRRVRARRAVVW